MIIITTYVILCIYSVSSWCKEVINISIDEDNNKSIDSVDDSIEKNINYPLSSSSGSSENYIPSDSSRHRNPKSKIIINSNSSDRNRNSKVDPRSYDKIKSIRAEIEHDNILRQNIDTTPHDVSLRDSLYHEDMGTISNKDNISLKKKLTTPTDEHRKKMRNERRNRISRTLPPDGNNIYQEKMQKQKERNKANIYSDIAGYNNEHVHIERQDKKMTHNENKRDDNLYHDKVENNNYYHGKISHRDRLRNGEIPNSGNDDEKIRRALCEEDVYRKQNIPTAAHEGNRRMQIQSLSIGNIHPGNMQSAPSDDDINYHGESVLEKDNLKEDNFYHDEIEKRQFDNKFNSERKKTALRKDNFYHGQIQKEPQGDNYSRKILPTLHDSIYFRKMQLTSENQNELDFTAPTNSTIEVSDHEYQESRNTEESDGERDSLVDYPYSVSIQRKGAHYASGALVGERWVLSTAAEFYNVREAIRLFRLRLGSADCKKGGVLIPLHTITIHPGFTPGKPSLDIAVLRMAEPVTFSSKVKPIGLSRVAGKVTSAKFLTTYWPRIVVKKGVIPLSAKERIKFNSMRVSTQALVPSDHCSKMMAAVNVTLGKSCLCLKTLQAHHSDCMPDVGAPVVAVDGLWGITSGWVAPLCPLELLPTVFTRVSTPDLRIWVDAQMVL